MYLTTNDIREEFGELLLDKDFVIDKTGCKMLELIGVSFIADESIFRKPNMDYVERELEWYNSMSCNVNDIPGETPKIWKQVATDDGTINSNYGWCIFSDGNGNQYNNVKLELLKNPLSRRALMIYNRPSMHKDYKYNGMSDFICTNAVQYMIRKAKLNAVVMMRSNDAIFGYLNDYQWQLYVLNKLAKDLNVEPGDIIWNVGSLHVYEQHFYLVDHFWNTGKTSIPKKEYTGKWK